MIRPYGQGCCDQPLHLGAQSFKCGAIRKQQGGTKDQPLETFVRRRCHFSTLVAHTKNW